VVERVAGRALLPDEIIHHMDFDKLNCCWCNLLLTSNEFNPTLSHRCPYTGRYLSQREWELSYYSQQKSTSNYDNVPEWVTNESDS
jgi:hypothetical protein